MAAWIQTFPKQWISVCPRASLSPSEPVSRIASWLLCQRESVFLVRMQMDTPDGNDFHTVNYLSTQSTTTRTQVLCLAMSPWARCLWSYLMTESSTAALKVFQHMYLRASKIILISEECGRLIMTSSFRIIHMTWTLITDLFPAYTRISGYWNS